MHHTETQRTGPGIVNPMLLHVSPEIAGDKVVLRRYKNGDGALVYEAVQESRQHLARWQDWLARMETSADCELAVRKWQADWQLRTRLAWCIQEHATQRFLGHIQLENIDWHTPSFGVGYWLRASAQGNGYMSHAAKLVCRVAFESLGAQRVHIECDSINARSAQVAHRLGFNREGVLRNERRDATGHLQDTLQFSMLPDDYETARKRWYK